MFAVIELRFLCPLLPNCVATYISAGKSCKKFNITPGVLFRFFATLDQTFLVEKGKDKVV